MNPNHFFITIILKNYGLYFSNLTFMIAFMPIALDANAFYFQALENGHGFAVVEERVVSPDFSHHFGLQAKIGVSLPKDCWQLSAQFLHAHARTHTRVEGTSHMWRLHMGIGDLFFERCLPLSPCFSWTPMWGVRYAMVRKKIYQNDSINIKNKYWGVGPLMGLEGFWQLWEGMGVFAGGVYSLLYGSLYLHQDVELLKLYSDEREEKNISEMALGFRFCRGCFTGQIAYEIYWLPGQNELYRGRATHLGDLSLHGVTFGIGLDF